MPALRKDGFEDAVVPALEALLSDLQHTTEVLKRAKLSDRNPPSDAHDLEPVYQEQTRSYSSSRHGLESIELMLDDYSQKRMSPRGFF
ncbi:unnamed protein product [Gongylonema pulchrum]|uniref:GIT1 n=1 Tax=Gongylonema pulchrum TaxID=637853 RepID=A0A183DQ81_9BILA|nr:unnamed protein product [Gongylonema pulchrum]